MQIAKQTDEILDTIQAILLSILTKLGPFFVALMPALFTGYSIYATFSSKVRFEVAIFFALVVSIAIETVGIVATHTAVDLYNGTESKIIHPFKFWLMVFFVPSYAFIVSAIVYFSGDVFDPLVRALGIGSPFLTIIVYVAVALARDLVNITNRQKSIEKQVDNIKIEERKWEREKQRIELEQKHLEKMERIRVKPVSNFISLDTKNVNAPQNEDVTVSKQDRVDTLLDIYRNDPNTSVTKVSKQLGVSRQTIYNYHDELQKEGVIHINGNGVEVLNGNG